MNIPIVRGQNKRLSKNFMSYEAVCKCGKCSGNYVSSYFRDVHQGFRDYLGRAIHPNSWFRCPSWNKKQGGVSGSRHLTGRACDFWVAGLTGSQLLAKARAYGKYDYIYQIKNAKGQLTNAIHADTKNHPETVSTPQPTVKTHVVVRGETLARIAVNLHVTLQHLKDLNAYLKSRKKGYDDIRPGDKINY